MAVTNGSFDTNGDGQPDTVASLQAQYSAWKPYYSSQLRKMLGNRLLLANTGSPSASDAALDGQTIEFEWCTAARGGLRACIAELEGQHTMSSSQGGGGGGGGGGGRTALSVMWLTDAKALPAETQCAELRSMQVTMPWLLAGLDRSDLTWPANASCTRSSTALSDDLEKIARATAPVPPPQPVVAASRPSWPLETHAPHVRFNWSTVPVFFHADNFTGDWNEESLRQLSRYPIVTIEKWMGSLASCKAGGWSPCCGEGGVCEEDRIISNFARLKAVNKNVSTVLCE